MRPPRDGEQLLLKLRMPWDGRSPRYLTRVHSVFSFASVGTGRSIGEPVETRLVDQLELFPEGTHYGT